MASFQVLTCFAYNREKEKLQTLLENGDVLSFNCTSNPCKAEEVWRPVTPDEAVTQMVLMSVEYITKDNETEYDSVVFGGLKNGQISLLDASKCEMVANVQAHEGIITCMEICTEIDDSGFQIVDTSHTLVTGGDDQTVRLWKINIVAGRKNVIISLAPMLRIKCSNIPNQISMYENTMCVALENPQNKGNLQMYRIEGLDAEEGVTIEYKELSHVEDEDHVEEITAIDKCPLLGLFASASTDGYIKIWNRHNQLIREMVFDESIYGMCFANSRGDILIGFQSHVCSIPLTSYFPQDYLERIVLHQFQDDVRENPIPYNNKIQPWFDPQQLPKFSTGFERRLWEKSYNIKEDKTTLEDLDQQKLKVPSRRRKSEQEAAEQEVRDKLAKLQKLGDIYSGMAEEQSVDQDADEDYEFDIHTERSEIWKEITDMLHVELSRSKEDQMSRTDGKTPPNIDQLTEWERKLLKRKPIIPIDGFIPNSVVRKYLGYTKPMSPRLKFKKGADRWRVKPVPRADPKHMPEGWIPEEEEEYDSYDITKPLTWGDTDEADSRSSSVAPTWKKVGMYVRTTSNLSTTSSKGGQHKASKRSTPSTPTARYELKSKKFDFGRVDLDLGTPDSSKLRMKSGGPTSRERSKSFRLTNMVVDEDSTNIRFKDGTKSGKRRGLLPAVDMEVVHKLLNEDWFPELHGSPSFDGIISTLMTMLDDTEDLDLHEKVCDYILEIHKEIGIPDVYLERIVSKLSNQLGHSKKNIKHDGLRMLKELGGDRQDVIATILPKLIDSQADIRAEAADILASLTGVKDKNDLLHLMESMGISSTYDSKEDEEEALKALAMRLDIPYRSDSFNDWIGNWVDDISTPGLYEGEDLKLADIDRTWDGRGKRLPPESLCISESNSRASNRIKELSFISDKSGGWTPDTQASGRRQKSFYGKELSRDAVVKEGRLDSRDSSRKGKVSRFDPRDPMLYKYYNDRFQRQVRPQSGKILQGGTLEGKEDDIQDIPSKFTDSMDVNSMTSSQDFPETISSQFGDGMSTQDSGIGRDISEISSHWKEFGPGKLVPIMATGQPGKPVSHIRIMGRPSKHRRQQLSPVKSTSTMSDVSLSPVLSKPKVLDYDWQKFFETPTALERKRLEKVRKDFSKGNLKTAELPTIRYIADGLPTLPGEAGLRLLHTIKVQEKGTLMEEEGRHRIQSIPGKLQVHTKDANTGMSRFGILQMKWTTGVPYSVTKEYDDISSKSGTCTPTSVASTITARSSGSKLDASRLNSLPSVKKGHKLKAKKIRSDDSILPNIHGNGPYSPDFEWEHPLPPPPAKDSRTNVAYIKKQHDSYCKYYNLAKKNMQRDISRRELGLPNVLVKHALSKTSLPPPPVLQKSLSKLSQTHSIIFPPITLAQLINT